ncbi:TAXI family TRAP transporter solute-binding subunit [Streptomyces sp. NBC_01808]|uniref:TAXI family TRAP transporter solute-binding subunit n=1 Tax=Streptomyces sp. NBC_01808 TaxID=2975947 RepID=UPI002DDC05B5|nr:TAXI family TRAP transporter solute-binding subunit [Streptomyces sp. NBC_01808]WSA36299.1 TAXI family TRAP transporter solute-binding subunit [Streptomyces sp. NBC_01808]
MADRTHHPAARTRHTEAARDLVELTWLGGNPGDGWYEMTEGLIGLLDGRDPALRLSLAAGGGRENLARIRDGEGHVGMSTDVVVAAAYNGGPPFDTPMSALRVLGTGWSPLPYNLLRAADAAAGLGEAIAGGGARLGAPPEDTTDELMFRNVVAHYGATYDAIRARGGRVLLDGYDALVRALHAGEIDYVFGATTLPAPSIAAAAGGTRVLELAPLPGDLVDHLARRYGCSPGAIPAGTYPGLHTADVATCFAETVLVVAADLAPGTAYALTRLLLGARDHLPAAHPSLALFNPATAWRNVPAPLHPDAARAYREAGFMT